MHVQKIVRKYKDREYVSWLLRRSFREDGKVRHETLANLSALPGETIEAVRACAGRQDPWWRRAEGCEIERSLPARPCRRGVGHGRQARDGEAVRARPAPERDVALALVVARAVRPASKLATTRWWAEHHPGG